MDDLELYEENEFETAKDAGKTMKRFIGSLGKTAASFICCSALRCGLQRTEYSGTAV